MSFKITGLAEAQFTELSTLTKAELATRNIHKIIADCQPGYPCRVSLQDAKVGDTVYLLNYQHHDAASPYAASHAIFVREGASQAELDDGELPKVFVDRPLSVRAFDKQGDMVTADLANMETIRDVIARMLAVEDVNCLHVHNARQGCFAARVERA